MDSSPLVEDEESDGSDGDDLLSPATFMIPGMGTVREIKTPQKGIRPENYSSPLVEQGDPKETHHHNMPKKYSLSKLLEEKKKMKARQDLLPDFQNELEEEIRRGGILGFVDNESLEESHLSLSQDLEESYVEGIASELKPKINELVKSVKNDFPDAFPGEYVFCNDMVSRIDPPPTDFLVEIELEDLPPSEYNALIEEWISSKAIADLLFLKTPVSCVLDWILNCMCHNPSLVVSHSASEILMAVIAQQAKVSENPCWHPSTDLYIKLLSDLGASIPLLLSNDSQCPSPVETNRDRINSKLSLLRLNKLQYLVNIYSTTLKCYPNVYSASDVRTLILVTAFLSLDPRLIFHLWDLQVLIGHAFQTFSDTQWEEEVLHISSKYAELTAHHRNYVHLADCIPPTERGLRFQHTLALSLIGEILQNGFEIPVNELKDSVRHDKLRLVLQICCSLSITESTDYYRLNSIISLVNLALPVSGYQVSQKKILEGIGMKFRGLNGSIRDPRGAFMDRTKVKDLIVRTTIRLNYFCQGLESQCHLEDYFEKHADSPDSIAENLPAISMSVDGDKEKETDHRNDEIAKAQDFNSESQEPSVSTHADSVT